MIRAYTATEAGGPLGLTEIDPGPLGPDQVEIDVLACGICHSDLSVLNNDWGNAQFPLVAGHEATGTISAIGHHVSHLAVGQTVGLGWYSASCLHCDQCMSGNHNLCSSNESTILGRPGGFADRVRCQAAWAIPLPDGVDPVDAGPLFCGGITVFNPIVQCGVKPTDRVGVIGIGGLGHFALQFLNKWGCEVTAFSSTDAKTEEARKMGAHHVVNSRDPQALKKLARQFDFIISTVNVDLDWGSYIDALGPKGRLHLVGAVLEPIPVASFALLGQQRSISGSPVGSPATIAQMLEFCARHGIAPITERFPMSEVNEALEHLRQGKARYRVVLTNDFS